MALLEISGLRKSFVSPDGAKHTVIDVPEFALAEKAQVALSGESGLGKTTFLNLIAGILKPDAGSIRLAGQDVSSLGESARDRLRATTLGYIFQTFNLLPAFTCLENVLLGMSFGPGADRAHAEALLRRVGLGERLRHYPRQLSTGQQQRVAVARALANRPKLVLADEPTGNLDHANAKAALKLIREACAENGAALLLVSHDREALAQFETVLDLAKINRANRPAEAKKSLPPDVRAALNIFGLSEEASFDDVRHAYREQLKQYHPDKVNHLGPDLRSLAESKSKEFNAAYQVLENFYVA